MVPVWFVPDDCAIAVTPVFVMVIAPVAPETLMPVPPMSEVTKLVAVAI